MAMYINGGTYAYREHKSITIMYTILIRNVVYNVLRVSLNRTTVTAYHMCVKFSLPKFIGGLSISEVVEENLIPWVN